MKSARKRLLVVDDDANHSGILSQPLERHLLDKIQHSHYDLVLLDQMMPGLSGLDLLRLLRATYSSTELPVITVAAGDQGHTVKPVAAGIDKRLTGLGDRQMMLDQLEAAVARNREFALLLLNLDRFKVVNDSCGVAVGDQILVEIAARLRSILPASGPTALARIGGDEFAILIDSRTSPAQPAVFAEKILTSILRPIAAGGFRTSISASIGVVESTSGAPAEDYLRDADLAMRRAKELGKNGWQMFHPNLLERARERWDLALDLRVAVERGELLAVYQTKVDLKTREIVGFEALMRWRHPQRGLLSPIEFIPIAEETGLIVPIGEWILREACSQLKIWNTKFKVHPPLTMNVNLSVKQLGDPDLLQRVRGAIDHAGISPDTLKLELTESSCITEVEAARRTLAGLRALGVGLKLDDFGTGYSSLSCLQALHFDSLKIDQSFVARMTSDPESRALVDTVIKLAHTLDMSVVAEGIEDEEQASALERLGCETGQGFLFSRPLDPAGIEALLNPALNVQAAIS